MKLSWIFDTTPSALAVAAAISGGVLVVVSVVVGFARRKLHRAAETDVDDFLLDGWTVRNGRPRFRLPLPDTRRRES